MWFSSFIMKKSKFLLTSKQALASHILDCSLRTLQTFKQKGELTMGIHYTKHYGAGDRFSEKALLEFRRNKERM